MVFDIIPPGKRPDRGPDVIIETRRRPRWWLRLFFLFLFVVAVSFGFVAVKAGTTFSVISEHVGSFLGIEPTRLPVGNPREQHRLDILLLGFRGEGDPHGGLLTDTMLVLSIDTERNDVALISIPRDIYVTLPIVNVRTKINEAFEIGESRQRNGGGLLLARLAAQDVLGINIDYAVAVDFRAFEDTINLLGGVDVNVAQPLHETQQWGEMDFYIPAGRQHMDGQTALYYVRSRFTTSDFDRARRQQEVLLAIRDKALSLGFLSNPAKLAELLDILGRHVRTDITASDLPKLFEVSRAVATKTPKRLLLSTSDGLLRSTTVNGSYVLLPASGSFDAIRERARGIFEPTSSSAPSTSSLPSDL